MNWILYFVVLVLCALSGLAGLTAGINLNPASTVKFVPVWGSAGDWVAGLGALLAVVVALLQSARQQEKERAKAKIFSEHGDDYWSVRVLSEGLVPVTVLSVRLEYDNYQRFIDLCTRPGSKLSLPHKLERGETLSILELNTTSFWNFSLGFGEPIVRALNDSGLHPADYSFGFNEVFFDQLKSAGLHRARLFFRTAHEDIKYELPQSLIASLIDQSVIAQRQRRERDISHLKESRAELARHAGLQSERPAE